MRFSRAWRAVVTLACVGALALGVTACVPSEPKPTPTPTKTAIFASEDEALQAAVDVYQQFNAVLDGISQSSKPSPDELKPLVSADFYSRISNDLTNSNDGEYTIGSSAFRDQKLISVSQSKEDATISIGICRDLTHVKVYDASGADITESRKVDVVPLEVSFVWNTDDSRLVIDGLDAWHESESC
ncbi:hypothetical protein [Paramicrobacterium chengjingii]|uniref:Lipoprotein n=1 Tax=Paramicrobacterium chengjingii TaxID=2769067 RepID=A0ABX6YG80_9MICO|nr:hypothetical protein [Microbacterium chengjingii]QPZ37796.1 hypothetical protein HCR76_13375 [Microbacterium chengjingii]